MNPGLIPVAAILVALTACGAEAGTPEAREAATLSPSETATPSPSSSPSPSPSASASASATTVAIPDDFPLLDGYPADARAEPMAGFGRRGPSRDLPPFVLEACGAQAPAPEADDQLRASWTNVEDFRSRQLTLFADEEQATSWAEAVLDVFRACPADGSDADGSARRTTVEDLDLGERSAVVTTAYTHRGEPSIGLNLTMVVRVGSAVLVSVTYNEGSLAGAPAQVEGFTDELEGVVRAMADLGAGR